MPRLLLVDDNQSIHKIAETLLTATDIELTCASSGAEALERIASSGPFDVALLDTSMQGMDGWTLLDRLRRNGPTALMPIAMMAGVLDVVDPEAVRRAPIQGFLKKPIELRDLADRIRTLLATPVAPPEPELEPEAVAPPDFEPEQAAPAGSGYATLPSIRLADHPFKPDLDLLILEPGDVLVEEQEPGEILVEEREPATEVPEVSYFQESAPDEASFEAPGGLDRPEPAPPEASFDADLDALELEELDLDGLKELPAPAEAPAAEDEAATALAVIQEAMAEHADFAPEDAMPSARQDREVVTDELPDLGPSLDLPEPDLPESDLPETGLPEPGLPETGLPEPVGFAAEPAPAPEPAPDAVLPDYWSDESETLLDLAPASAALADHSDFGPDSFLDQDAGPEPTPSFLPEILDEGQAPPAQVTPAATPRVEEAFLDLDEQPDAGDTDTVEFYPDNTGLLTFPTEDLGEPAPSVQAELPAAAPEATAPEPALATAMEPAPAIAKEPALPAAGDPLAAILADPVLLDRLAKAVVARLGDQVLREIAWEVMPEMADRLHRP